MNTIAQKKCGRCQTIKLFSDFYKNKDHKDGLSSLCKICVDVSGKAWAVRNKEKVRGYLKKWRDEHKEEERERIKKYKKEHKEEVRASARKYTEKNSEKINAYCREYYKDHKKQKVEKGRQYRAQHPGKNTQYTNNRRARRVGNGGIVTEDEWQELLKKYNNTCLGCGRSGVKLTRDHVIPLSLSGIHHISNIQPLCGSCNSSKHVKIIDYRPKE